MVDPRLISAFHIVVVAPLLFLLATDRFPTQYKKYIVYLAAGVAMYHIYRLCSFMSANMTQEGMEVINGLNVHHIKMFDSSPGFEYPVLNIKQGDVVVWTNLGEVKHTVTSVNFNLAFNSGYMLPGSSFSARFKNKGVFDYFSIPDQGWMIGRIVVN